MATSEVKFGIRATLVPQPSKAQQVHNVLTSMKPLAVSENNTQHWFSVKYNDEFDGTPGGFGFFSTFASEAARKTHLHGEVLKSLSSNADLFSGSPDVHPVNILAHKLPTNTGHSPVVGAQIIMKTKPGLSNRVKRILTGRYYNEVNQEDGTPIWFALQIDDNTFGLFATFESQANQVGHLNGHAVWHLMDEVAHSLESVKSYKFDVLASKC